MWLVGQHEVRLDAQRRLVLPLSMRGAFQSGCVVTPGLERCLLVFPNQVWEEFVERFRCRSSLAHPQVRRLARHLFGGAAYVAPDGQGRIRVGRRQVEYAALERELVMIGVGTHAEIWAPEGWSQQFTDALENAEKDAEAISSLLTRTGD